MLRFALAFVLSTVLAVSTWAQTPPSISSQASDSCTAFPLSAGAEQVANEIGIAKHVERLRSLVCARDHADSLEELVLRQQITEAVTVASLDIDETAAQIDYERAQILETENLINNRKNRTVNLLSVANIVAGTGSGILTNAMQFSDRTAFAGDGIGIAGSGIGVLLSILGLRVQGGTATLGIAPNMLAAIFNREAEKHSVYPPEVWAYLNSQPEPYPAIKTSWREDLIRQWQEEKRIGSPDAPSSQKRIQLLTSSIREHTRLSLDVLTDRSGMLMDVRARLLLMKGALRDLVRALIEIDPVPSTSQQ